MKKYTLSIALCTALLVSTITHATPSLSLKELHSAIQKNPDKSVIFIDFDQFLVMPNKQELEQEFQAMQEQVIVIMEQEKDQEKLKEAFEQIGLAFAQKMVAYLKPISAEHVDTIKHLQETNAKVIFITDFQPAVVDLIIEHLTKYGIDTTGNMIEKEPTVFRSKDDETEFGAYAQGILFVMDRINYQAAAEQLLTQTKIQAEAVYFLGN